MNIFLINLENRTDRLKHAIEEFDKIGLNFERFNAIKSKNGALGCTMSHIEVLKFATEQKLEFCMICEDDIEFYINREEFNFILKNFLDDPDLNILVLIPNIIDKKSITKYNDIFYKSYDIQTTTCYIIKEKYYKTLLENFEISKENLSQNKSKALYSLDIVWKILQRKDIFAIPNKVCGTQYSSYSDISKKIKKRKNFGNFI
jgi:GR25 family glycosyltransferase involved in LPS biosynthesis